MLLLVYLTFKNIYIFIWLLQVLLKAWVSILNVAVDLLPS